MESEKVKYIFIHGLGWLGQSGEGWEQTISSLSIDSELIVPH